MKHTKPWVIGILGGSGTGKTFLGQALCQYLHAPFIEGDEIGRQVIEQPSIVDALVDVFDPSILMSPTTINRMALGQKVFGHPEALAKLNAIMHPVMYKAIEEQILQSTSPIVILEAAVMIEAGFLPLVDQIIFVSCDEDVRVNRLVDKRHIAPDKARAMIASGRDDYRDYAHIEIDTSYGLDCIKREVDIMMDTIRGGL